MSYDNVGGLVVEALILILIVTVTMDMNMNLHVNVFPLALTAIVK